DPDLAQTDLGGQLAKTHPPLGRGAGASEVLVDDGDCGLWPAELDRALAERVLAGAGLVVAFNLSEGRLAHVDDRPAAAVGVGDLGELTHRAGPPRSAPKGAPA